MKSFLTFLVMLMFTDFAVAQEIDPCANESGAGYGLCNAYCVAMNCDDPDLQEASAQACEKVAANYNKIVGGVLTCGECPCFTEQVVDEFIAASADNVQCDYDQGGYTTIYGSPTWENLLQAENPDNPPNPDYPWQGAPSDSCFVRINSTSGTWTYDIPEKDSLACRALLLSKINYDNCDVIWDQKVDPAGLEVVIGRQ